jgi:endonuclease I
MKKMIVLLFMSLIFLSACQPNEKITVDRILENIKIGFAAGDDENQVTQNLQLPLNYQNMADVNITWQSDHLEIVDAFGAVNRPLRDTNVILEVTVVYNNQNRVKHFALLVIGTLAKHEVTFIVDEAIFGVEIVYEGDFVEMPHVEVSDGDTVLGWFELDAELPFDFDLPVTEDMILYLRVEVKTSAQYLVKYYFQNIEDDLYTLEADEVNEGYIGQTVTADENFDGFMFAEGFDRTGVVLADGSLVIHVYYERVVYEVEFFVDNTSYETLWVRYEGIVGDSINDPLKEDFVFVSWLIDVENQTPFDINTPITDHLDLYAFFEAVFVYEGYYEGADGLGGEDLINFLRSTITRGLTPTTYGEARDILQESDEDPNNPNNVLTIYNRWSVDSTWTGLQSDSTWNREHVWPQSRLDSSASNSSRNSASDLHNLRPATPSVNSSRGNKDFDFVTTSATYFPGHDDKGDVARIYFYMVTRYSQFTLVDYDMLSSPSRPLYSGAVLSALLQFHLDDPVDDFERNRNEVIYSYQGNRNPFIDHPEFVMLIWGDVYEQLDYSHQDEHVHVIVVVVYHQVDMNQMRRKYQQL